MTHPKQSTKEKIILGIDPGTNVMGFGVLKVSGQRLEVLSMGSVQMKDPDYGLKLKRIFEKVLELIDQYHPDEFAVEAPFFWEERTVHVEARTRPRCIYGCCFVPRYSHF